MSRRRITVLTTLALLAGAIATTTATPVAAAGCTRTVDAENLQGAVNRARSGDVVCIRPGVYRGALEIERRFGARTVFRALDPYRTVLRHSDTVVEIDGARNVTLQGLRIRHTRGGRNYVVLVSGSDDRGWAEDITLRNNIIHDSYDNDLLKVHDGTRHAVIAGNLLYNQGPSEQHMDINSVTDVTIRDNVLFNDYASSDRRRPEVKHFIVVKDSNRNDDGLRGSRRIAISRNVFLNWQGQQEAWIAVGNDGMPYYEAQRVTIAENLMLGNSRAGSYTPLQVMGARYVRFVRNQVLGNLPGNFYGYRLGTKGSNPSNQDIAFRENVWADPSGTMGSLGKVENTAGFVLRSNTYWNGGESLPAEVRRDSERTIRNPRVPGQRNIVLPVYRSGFASGSQTVAQERQRLRASYGVQR